jgi:hypothetical protein
MAKLNVRNRNEEQSALDKLKAAKLAAAKKMPGKKAGATVAAKKRGKPKYKIT